MAWFSKLNAARAGGVALLLAIPTLAWTQDGRERRGRWGRDESPVSDRYTIEARLYVANDNDSGAPTLLGRVPSKGTLTFVAVGEVLNGQYAGTRLDGARFGFFGRSTGVVREGQKFEAISLYLDGKTPSDQRRALGEFFRATDTFRADGLIPLVTAPITLEKSGGGLAPISCKIGDRGDFTITPLPGRDHSNPITIYNAHSYFPDRDAVVVGTAHARFHDHARDLNVSNGSGEIHVVRFTGSPTGIVEEGAGRMESRTEEPSGEDRHEFKKTTPDEDRRPDEDRYERRREE